MKKVFFFQAEDGIRDLYVTGVQTCALPISFRPAVAVKQLLVLGIKHPFDHWRCHLRKARYEMVIAQRESWDPIHRIGNDPRAFWEFAHLEPLRSRVATEARTDLALGIGMQAQRHTCRRRCALARVIVRCRPDPPEAEDDVPRGETATERRR